MGLPVLRVSLLFASYRESEKQEKDFQNNLMNAPNNKARKMSAGSDKIVILMACFIARNVSRYTTS